MPSFIDIDSIKEEEDIPQDLQEQIREVLLDWGMTSQTALKHAQRLLTEHARTRSFILIIDDKEPIVGYESGTILGGYAGILFLLVGGNAYIHVLEVAPEDIDDPVIRD